MINICSINEIKNVVEMSTVERLRSQPERYNKNICTKTLQTRSKYGFCIPFLDALKSFQKFVYSASLNFRLAKPTVATFLIVLKGETNEH